MDRTARLVAAAALGAALAAGGCSGSFSAVGDHDVVGASTGADAGVGVGADADASAADAGPGAGGADGATPFVTAPHLPWPAIPNHGGHELSPLRVVSVMAVDEPLAAQLTAFGDAVPQSAWYASFAAEYGLSGTPTHLVLRGAHVAPGTSFTQAAMNQYVADAIAVSPSPSPPAPDGKTIYVLYLPPGTTLDDDGTPDTACALVPYHTGYGALGDGIAVMNRCKGSFPTLLDLFTTVAAHEIAEAATDSNPLKNPAWEMWPTDTATPWTSSIWNQVEMENGAENGDLCIFTRSVEQGFSFQRIYSNAAAAKGGDPCVPSIPIPFFDVSPDPATGGWFRATAGATVDAPLHGWSTAPTGDWLVSPLRGNGSAGGHFPASLVGAPTHTVGGYAYSVVNNGAPVTLRVTIPSGAASGWWGAVELWSWHATPTGDYVDGEDFGHEAVIGFYVP